MGPRSRIWLAGGLAMSTLLLVACAGSQDRVEPRSSPSPMTPFSQRCGAVHGVDVTDVAIPVPELGRSKLSGGIFAGDADDSTVVILLHQDDSEGLCGWRAFAREAATAGVTSLAVDLCWYGESQCSGSLEGKDHAEVSAMVDFARLQLDAESIVLMGASLGAHLTVRSVAVGLPVQAWVSVSPPSSYVGVDLRPLRDDLAERDLPGMVLYSRADGAADFRAARDLARAARVPFLSTPPGHGYDLLTTRRGELTPAGSVVLKFLAEH